MAPAVTFHFSNATTGDRKFCRTKFAPSATVAILTATFDKIEFRGEIIREVGSSLLHFANLFALYITTTRQQLVKVEGHLGRKEGAKSKT